MLDTRLNRRPVTRRKAVLTIISCLAVAIPIAAAQAALSSVSGLIVDTTNAVLPGVQLTLINTQTGAKFEVQSDREGRYEFAGLAPGQYAFESKLPGFATVKGTVVVTGQDIQRDLKLEVGSLQETITLVAGPGASPPPPPLNAEEADARKAKLDALRTKLSNQRCPGNVDMTSRIGGNIRVPMKLVDVRPVYPAGLAASGSSGLVQLRAIIDTEGNVRDVAVLSATSPEFASSAVVAVRQWQFSGTLLNCQAIDVVMNVAVNYQYKP